MKAERIAAFRNIANEAGRSYGKITFLPNSILRKKHMY
jgi:hypothetical protein